MAAHPFGPIEKSLIVAYYKRSNFHLQRVRLKRENIKIIKLKTEKSEPIYKYLETTVTEVKAFVGHKAEMKADFKVSIRRKIEIPHCFIEELVKVGAGFGFKISVSRGIGNFDPTSSVSWPTISICILGVAHKIRQKYEVTTQGLQTLFGDEEILEFLEPLKDHEEFEVKFTLEGIKFTADGTVLHQFTKFKKLLDPERVKPHPVLRATCLPVQDLTSHKADSFFGQLTSYLLSQIGKVNRIWNHEGKNALIVRALNNIKNTLSAIEYYFFRIWYSKSFVEFIPVHVLRNMIEIVKGSIDSFIAHPKTSPRIIENFIMNIVMTAKNLYL